MTSLEQLQAEIRRALGDRPATSAALAAGLPRNAIRSILAGHEPKFSRAVDVARALGIQLRFGAVEAIAARPAGPALREIEAAARTVLRGVAELDGRTPPTD